MESTLATPLCSVLIMIRLDIEGSCLDIRSFCIDIWSPCVDKSHFSLDILMTSLDIHPTDPTLCSSRVWIAD